MEGKKVGAVAVLAMGLAAVSIGFAEPAFVMRIDDNHSEKEWTRVADIFEKRGIKVSFAVVPAALSESQGKCLKQLAERGHELMDHMPNHSFYKATHSHLHRSFRTRNHRTLHKSHHNNLLP